MNKTSWIPEKLLKIEKWNKQIIIEDRQNQHNRFLYTVQLVCIKNWTTNISTWYHTLYWISNRKNKKQKYTKSFSIHVCFSCLSSIPLILFHCFFPLTWHVCCSSGALLAHWPRVFCQYHHSLCDWWNYCSGEIRPCFHPSMVSIVLLN